MKHLVTYTYLDLEVHSMKQQLAKVWNSEAVFKHIRYTDYTYFKDENE